MRFGGQESERLLYSQQQQKRLLALLDFGATKQPQHLATVAEVEAWLLDENKPPVFVDGDPRNVQLLARRQFGQLCAALAEKGYGRPQELSLFDFNSAVDYLTAKQKPA